MADHIRYDLLTQQALRGVVRSVLADAAKKGLTGDHHFYISFNTQADGVRLSQRLLAQYPEEMTIILQHQFWDLTVDDDTFELGLSFGGVPEKLTVPFDAINGFYDPSVQFGLQFEAVGEGQDNTVPLNTEAKQPPAKKNADMRQDTKQSSKQEPRKQPARGSVPAVGAGDPERPEPPKPASGAEVVRLDRFRKK